jgi:DNA-binding MarR family transcriptional regulator
VGRRGQPADTWTPRPDFASIPRLNPGRVGHNLVVAKQTPTPNVAEPKDSSDLAARVEVAARSLFALSARASMDLPGNVSLIQLRALAAAEEAGPCSLGALADALMVSTSSASRLVDRLATSGVLDRRPSEVSRREIVLEVTPKGRRLLRRHEASRRAVFAEVVARMNPAEVRALLRGLEAVGAHLHD